MATSKKTTSATKTNENETLLREVSNVSTRVNGLKDDVLTLRNDVEIFKKNVATDLRKIVEFLGKQK